MAERRLLDALARLCVAHSTLSALRRRKGIKLSMPISLLNVALAPCDVTTSQTTSPSASALRQGHSLKIIDISPQFVSLTFSQTFNSEPGDNVNVCDDVILSAFVCSWSEPGWTTLRGSCRLQGNQVSSTSQLRRVALRRPARPWCVCCCRVKYCACCES